MSTLKEWVLQLRYPYTAGTVGLLWLGGGAVTIIRPEVLGEFMLAVVSVATCIVAWVGFSSTR